MKKENKIHIIKDDYPIVMIEETKECKKGRLHVVPYQNSNYPKLPVESNWRVFMIVKNPSDKIDIKDIETIIKAQSEAVKKSLIVEYNKKIEEDSSKAKDNDNKFLILPKELRDDK